MDIQNLVIAGHHISLVRLMKDYHSRHYIWEMAKIMVPAFITGVITFLAMRIIDNKNKKRWLNDGHIKRKVELEIQIRKFLLGLKDTVPDEYYELADRESEESDSKTVYNFNKDFEALYKHLEAQEQQRGGVNDESIFALMDEYVCYVPKVQNMFNDFKAMSEDILKLEQENHDLKDKANIYLCFQDVIERILKKLTVKKLK